MLLSALFSFLSWTQFNLFPLFSLEVWPESFCLLSSAKFMYQLSILLELCSFIISTKFILCTPFKLHRSNLQVHSRNQQNKYDASPTPNISIRSIRKRYINQNSECSQALPVAKAFQFRIRSENGIIQRQGVDEISAWHHPNYNTYVMYKISANFSLQLGSFGPFLYFRQYRFRLVRAHESLLARSISLYLLEYAILPDKHHNVNCIRISESCKQSR